MLALSQSVDYTCSRSPLEKPCYTQLQPVSIESSLGSLIASSTNMCLPGDLGGDSSCSEYSASSQGSYYSVQTAHLDQPCFQISGDFSSSDSRVSAHSPEIMLEEDLTDIQEVLQPRMTGCRQGGDEDGSDYYYPVLPDHILQHHTVDNNNNNSHYPPPPFAVATGSEEGVSTSFDHHRQQQNQHHLHHSPHHHHHHHHHRYGASPTTAATTTTASSLYVNTASAAATTVPTASAGTGRSLHYYDNPSVIHDREANSSRNRHHHNNHHPHYHHSHHPHHPPPSGTADNLSLSGSPPPSSSHLKDLKYGVRSLPVSSAMSLRVSRFMEEDDDDDAEYKPYCDSRRGAKKNLLWKFLLYVLDNHTDLAQWVDIKQGVFKFVDTARTSSLWGQRKQRNDMTFEKLSRGIRHYYKRGLMERLSNTRLVYKFNWEKVPKRQRRV